MLTKKMRLKILSLRVNEGRRRRDKEGRDGNRTEGGESRKRRAEKED